MWIGLRAITALSLVLLSAAAFAQAWLPPRHTLPPPPFFTPGSQDEGVQYERNRAPADALDEHRKLERALRALLPQRRGVVDAYVVAVALDSDPVFGREARAAAGVLGRRYGAAGRTIVLAGPDGSGPSALPRGSPDGLAVALARIAELIDRREDALILYATSHGAPVGLYYNDGDLGYGLISPGRLGAMLDGLGLANRLLILNACYAGAFVPRLQSPTSAIIAASSFDRTSFGCIADNDWTFFGDAIVNHGLRKPQPLAEAFAEAQTLVAGWEARVGSMPSQPQVFIGADAARWLGALERRLPAASAPAGRPAIETSLIPVAPR